MFRVVAGWAILAVAAVVSVLLLVVTVAFMRATEEESVYEPLCD